APMLFADDVGSFSFRQPWPVAPTLLVLLAVAGYVVFFYRRESGLASSWRWLLASLRVVLCVLVVLLLLEPVLATAKSVLVPSNILVLLDVSRSMTIADERRTPEDLEDAALALGKMSYADRGTPPGSIAGIDRVSRWDLARAVLQHPELPFFRQPG